MTLSMVLLTAISVLIFFGILERVLDRMYLTDRAALAVTATMFAGGLLPDLDFGRVSINIGGALIPLVICLFLLIKADTSLEKWRTILGSILTAAAVYGLSILLPAEAEALPLDPMLLYAACGGLIAWLLGRSRRGAFVCGILGVILADVATALVNWYAGIDQQLVLGGAGLADAVVVSGVLAVLLCELAGEITERIVRRKKEKKA